MSRAIIQRRFGIVVPTLAGLAITLFQLPVVTAAEDAPAQQNRQRQRREQNFTHLLQDDVKEKWVGYGMDKWPEGWQVNGNVLHRASGGGDIMTKKEYRDFDLRFGWKVSEGGNSGVMYRVSVENGPAYWTGPEYQILDNAKHVDGKDPLTSSGALYGLYAPAADAAKPAGEWNRGRIVVRGDHVQHFLNGRKVVDAKIGSDEWNRLVAGSKFAVWPKFGKNDSGHIVFQDHGDKVWFRNIRIRELNGSPTSSTAEQQ